MTQPRSSLAIALQDYRGIRPGIALTIAAVALITALAVGSFHVVMLGRSGVAISEGQKTIRALHSYNVALEVWRQIARTPDQDLRSPRQERLRDSIGGALRVNLRDLRSDLTNPFDQELVGEILEDLTRPRESDVERFELGEQGRGAMIVLTARQDSALFQAAAEYQRAQFLAAVVIALTVVAAGVLIVPMSWVYVRYKRGVPPGL